MTALDTTFRNLAKNLIADYGPSAILRRKDATYDVTSGKAAQSGTDYDVKISPPSPVTENMVNGTVENGDLVTYVAAQGLAIRPSINTDYLVWDSDEWKLVEVKPLVSGDQFAAYRVVFRK